VILPPLVFPDFKFSHSVSGLYFKHITMEQRALKNANTCLNINIYSYLETFGGQSSNQNLNVVHFFNTSVNYISVPA
jgi:hypothetical protein